MNGVCVSDLACVCVCVSDARCVSARILRNIGIVCVSEVVYVVECVIMCILCMCGSFRGF